MPSEPSPTVRFYPHARERMVEHGAAEEEVAARLSGGERFPVRFGRTGFRRNFPYQSVWRGRHHATKQTEAYAVEDGGAWLVITVFVKDF